MPTHAMLQPKLAEPQTRLRDRLLDRHNIQRRECRDLAARLLLYIDDTRTMFDVCLEWLNECLEADRADVGLLVKGKSYYSPSSQHFQPLHSEMPSVLGASFPISDSMITTVLLASAPLVLNDIRLDLRMHPAMREQLLAFGVHHKLSVALRAGSSTIGLLCLDRGRDAPPWGDAARDLLQTVAHDLLQPIFCELIGNDCLRLDGDAQDRPAPERALTQAEKRVARLVLEGCSYKEIARQLGRSKSTVDHQLRSLRSKLGVHSTPKLHGALLQIQHELANPAFAMHN